MSPFLMEGDMGRRGHDFVFIGYLRQEGVMAFVSKGIRIDADRYAN